MVIQKFEIKSSMLTYFTYLIVPIFLISAFFTWSFSLIFTYSKLIEVLIVFLTYLVIFTVFINIWFLLFLVIYNKRRNKKKGIKCD